MVKLIQGMKAGEAKTIEITDANAYLIVMKHDVTKKTQSQLSTDNGRLSVLNRMKSKEFTDMLESEAKNLKNVQLNDKALNAYPPKLFVPKDTASAAG
jgi:dTDP-glucose pyrophosphorylase